MLESHTKVPINRVPHPRQERALTPFLVHLHSAHAPSGAWYFAVLAAFRPFGVSALIGIAIAIEPPDGSWGRGRRPQGAAPQGPRPAKGHVVDAQCASDADLDAARALLPRRSTFPGDALPAGGAAHRRRHHGGGDRRCRRLPHPGRRALGDGVPILCEPELLLAADLRAPRRCLRAERVAGADDLELRRRPEPDERRAGPAARLDSARRRRHGPPECGGRRLAAAAWPFFGAPGMNVDD